MQQVVETLNAAMPFFVVGSLSIFMTVEVWRPYFLHGTGRTRQRWRNVAVIAIALFVSVAVSSLVAMPIVWSETNRFGLLYRLFPPSALPIAIGMFLVDLCLYVLHVTMHKVPVLWRVHRMHHADTELDASSGLRAHPLELMFLLAMSAMILPLLGVSMTSYVLYSTLAVSWFSLNHSNVQFPNWFERGANLLMSTPNWHRVHHSSYQPETDSHYGCVFSVWDRLFGTTRPTNVETIRFGLEDFRGPDEQTIGALLRIPFKKP